MNLPSLSDIEFLDFDAQFLDLDTQLPDIGISPGLPITVNSVASDASQTPLAGHVAIGRNHSMNSADLLKVTGGYIFDGNHCIENLGDKSGLSRNQRSLVLDNDMISQEIFNSASQLADGGEIQATLPITSYSSAWSATPILTSSPATGFTESEFNLNDGAFSEFMKVPFYPHSDPLTSAR
ncbi:hypothetical protein AOQ84DRAFT_385524 [Glonium stellatum]|uniref:Uncharacterized protein n=1 Tax=Glonium stellatum TaxID=574774 RepID=A0A8E2FAX0_9PEZI|nr:hypothetical protein AOQ84DRAFT_385524 [Glonium stellatum]